MSDPVVTRAQGCLLGQLAGDSLGSLVEFRSPAEIRGLYPDGIRLLADGGTYGTIAGQPTDDSEMALALARAILRKGAFDPGEVAVAYADWFDSAPFDFGNTTAVALRPAVAARRRGDPPSAVAEATRTAASGGSQANGALMRVSPLALFTHALPADLAADLARQDAALTHPHPVCRDANAVFVVALAHAIATGSDAAGAYAFALHWARDTALHPAVVERLESAATSPPADYQHQQGWVLTALQNAFWQLVHSPDLQTGVCDTVMRGGDTDTNAAIAGALLGAVHGLDSVPAQWREKVLGCRPGPGRPGVRHARPQVFWPVDALELGERLVELGIRTAALMGARAAAQRGAGVAADPPPADDLEPG